MNKKVLALIAVFLTALIVVLIVLLNRKKTVKDIVDTDPRSSIVNTENVTLIWWNLFEEDSTMQPIIDKYESLNPHVKIQYVKAGAGGVKEYREDIIVNLSDDDIVSSPDIFSIHNTWTDKFIPYMVPAGTAISQDSLEDFYPTVSIDFYRNNNLYALPLYLDGIAMIYNKDLLAKEGINSPSLKWSEFDLQSAKLTKWENNKVVQAGFSACDSSNSEFYFEMVNNLFMQNNINILDESGKAQLDMNSKVNDILQSYTKYCKGSTDEITWDKSFPKDIATFLYKKLAMYPAPSWRLNDILVYNDKYKLNLNVGVVTTPQLFMAEEVYFPSYWGLAVSKDSQHPQEAWKLIQFLTEEAQLKELNTNVLASGRKVGIVYPRMSMKALNKSDEYLNAYVTSMEKAKVWNMYDGWAMKEKFNEIFVSGKMPQAKEIDSVINQIMNH